MTDCPNAEMRDQLPDLLHEQLPASARAAVLAHVAECPDCRVELAVLREARQVFSSGARTVDVATVARFVVERFPQEATTGMRRKRWVDWRIAASVVLLAAGGASVVMLRHRGSRAPEPVPAVAVTVAPSTPDVAVIPGAESTLHATATVAPGAELSAAGGVSELSDSELRALVDDLQTLDALPSADPDPVAVRVSLPGSERSE